MMDKQVLQAYLTSRISDAAFEEGGKWLNMQVPAEQWLPAAQWLKSDDKLQFDFLFCLTCIDWLSHLTMVYHLRSTSLGHTLVVKCRLDRNEPAIETVASIWKTAEFHEREVYELFGVRFHHHPDLRKLILPDNWEGYPLRKDYEDPVNMIKL